MKLCILGNSHAAALKHGWDSIAASHPGITIHIYSMLGQNMRGMELDGQMLRAPEKGKAALRSFPAEAGQAADLGAYDAFVLHGLGLRAIPFGKEISSAVRAAAAADSLHGTALWTLLGTIRSVSRAPVRAGATPLQAAVSVVTEGPSAGYREHLRLLQAGLDAREALLVPQPEETVVNGGMTHPKYNTGVMGIGKNAPAKAAGERHDDLDHMNPEFGALMLRAYFASF